jgi:hypothetical protein
MNKKDNGKNTKVCCIFFNVGMNRLSEGIRQLTRNILANICIGKRSLINHGRKTI